MKTCSQSDVEAVDQRRVEDAIESSQQRLWDEDRLLLRLDAHERSICFRLATYLAEQFPEFDVDCEYNRNHAEGNYQKRVRNTELIDLVKRQRPRLGNEDGLMILPDIIVHIRDKPMNLLVIEAKKTSSQIPEDKDLLKLQALKEELGYRFARFIKFDVGPEITSPGIADRRIGVSQQILTRQHLAFWHVEVTRGNDFIKQRLFK